MSIEKFNSEFFEDLQCYAKNKICTIYGNNRVTLFLLNDALLIFSCNINDIAHDFNLWHLTDFYTRLQRYINLLKYTPIINEAKNNIVGMNYRGMLNTGSRPCLFFTNNI